MQKLSTRLRRWQQLSRYYVNKWQYDGSKFVERVWYGQGSHGAGRAQVPFMITRQMRQQLEAAGFPSAEISRMLPQAAHQAITDKVTYAHYVQQKQEQAEIERLAATAKRTLAAEQQQQQQSCAAGGASASTSDTSVTSVTVVATETDIRDDSYSSGEADANKPKATAATSVAVVAQQDPAKL